MKSIKQKGSVKFAKGQNEFFSTLKKRVNIYFKEKGISKHANAEMVIKSIVLLGTFIFSLLYIMFAQPAFLFALLIWSIMGFAKAGIGMSVMHDANHGAYSANNKVNEYIGYTLNMLGGAVFNWKLQHNILHHTYTNITHMDDDIDAKVVLRLSPHLSVKNFHRAQFVYAFFLYGITTLYWVVAKDFVQFVKYTKNGVNNNDEKKNRETLMRIIGIKVAYFFFMVFLPIYMGVVWWQVILGFLLMHFIAGVVLTVIFQLAHSVEETTHPMPDENGMIENNWAIHQMNTTVNFSPNNRLINWYVGGLNFQVEHHLFPKICHVHYPAIAKIVRKTAEEYGIPYLENETFSKALKSHFSLLYNYGRIPHLNEAIV